MAAQINARTLKGFRDHLPADMAPRREMLRVVERVFEVHGFAPLDTPALEYAEVLAGKYGEEGDKLLYRFADHGGRDVALRYDLTVPLARVVAQHGGALAMPLRRYHIASVWRADKPQRGRFREFMQCDVDIAGSASAMADAEVLITGMAAVRALGVTEFTLHLNHRDLLRALLAAADVREEGAQLAALRAIDKWDKVGEAGVRRELSTIAGLDEAGIDELMSGFALAGVGAASADDHVALNADLMSRLRASLGELACLDRLAEVLALVDAAGLAGHLRIDPTIARGLDYYTGVIFETRLTDARVAGMGAVMSGGRYDGLIGMFGKQAVPAVGISLGLDRLLAALRELGLAAGGEGAAAVYVTVFDRERQSASVAMASSLRAAGLTVELDTEGGKLAKQFKRADRRGNRFVVVIGDHEAAAGVAVLKALDSGAQQTLATADVAAAITASLGHGDLGEQGRRRI